jgi:hypothetical protein
VALKVRMVWAGAEGAEKAPRALAFMLDVLTRWNVELMRERARAGDPVPPLYQSGARYQRENYAGLHPEDWRDCLQVIRSGGGDCEDLAAYLAAELRVQGDEGARCMFISRERPDGGRLFHIVVQRGDGSLEDPSRALGMNAE